MICEDDDNYDNHPKWSLICMILCVLLWYAGIQYMIINIIINR